MIRTASGSSPFGSPSTDTLCNAPSAASPTPDDTEFLKKVKKFGKFFSTRLIQIVIQSRCNQDDSQPCMPNPSTSDWYNLKVVELGEVSAQIKKSVQKFPPETPYISIDFFLYTAQGETLPLESWCFSLDESEKRDDYSTEQKQLLYHQLGVLLKSAMVASRMTPMHRYYVKKQSPETFIILYKIFNGPSMEDLGMDAKRVNLGLFPTSCGSFRLDLAYRTRMELDRTVTPSSETEADGFQKVSASGGTTPDGDRPQASSPVSVGGISHFSTSPPTENDVSPATSPADSDCLPPASFRPPPRSRSVSVNSDDGGEALREQREREKAMLMSQQIPKGMPFANLLAYSYTGVLLPVKEQDPDSTPVSSPSGSVHSSESTHSTIVGEEERDRESADREENVKDQDKNKQDVEEERHTPRFDLADDVDDDSLEAEERDRLRTLVPICSQQRLDVQAARQLVSARRASGSSVTSESSTGQMVDKEKDIKAEVLTGSDDGRLESDDDSFVKLQMPLFNNSESAGISPKQELGMLIALCKSPTDLETASDEFGTIPCQLDEFSKRQGEFDRFVAQIRNHADANDD